MSRTHTTSSTSATATTTEATTSSKNSGNDRKVRRKVKVRQALSESALVQPKLKIGSVNDPLEREADIVAERVMNTPAPVDAGAGNAGDPAGGSGGGAVNRMPVAGDIQREAVMPDDEDMLRKKPVNTIQREAVGGDDGDDDESNFLRREAASGSAPPVTPEINSGVQGLRGRGQKIAAVDRSFFVPRMPEVNLDRVRLHTDQNAQSLARSVNARAFTFENNVVMGRGEYTPGTASGRRLMAHELAHVAQQGRAPAGGQFARKPIAGGLIQREVPPQFKDRVLLTKKWGSILKWPTDDDEGQIIIDRSLWGGIKHAYGINNQKTRTMMLPVMWLNGVTDDRRIHGHKVINLPNRQEMRKFTGDAPPEKAPTSLQIIRSMVSNGMRAIINQLVRRPSRATNLFSATGTLAFPFPLYPLIDVHLMSDFSLARDRADNLDVRISKSAGAGVSGPVLPFITGSASANLGQNFTMRFHMGNDGHMLLLFALLAADLSGKPSARHLVQAAMLFGRPRPKVREASIFLRNAGELKAANSVGKAGLLEMSAPLMPLFEALGKVDGTATLGVRDGGALIQLALRGRADASAVAISFAGPSGHAAGVVVVNLHFKNKSLAPAINLAFEGSLGAGVKSNFGLSGNFMKGRRYEYSMSNITQIQGPWDRMMEELPESSDKTRTFIDFLVGIKDLFRERTFDIEKQTVSFSPGLEALGKGVKAGATASQEFGQSDKRIFVPN